MRKKNVTYLSKVIQLFLGISKLMFYPEQCSRKPEQQNKRTKLDRRYIKHKTMTSKQIVLSIDKLIF